MDFLLRFVSFVCLFATFLQGFVASVQPPSLPSTTPHHRVRISTNLNEIRPKKEKNLAINCTVYPTSDSKIATIVTLAISKWNESTESLDAISQVSAFEPEAMVVEKEVGAVITGLLNTTGGSFISLEWRFPGREVLGIYACEVSAMDDRGRLSKLRDTLEVKPKSKNCLRRLSALRRKLNKHNKRLASQDQTIRHLNTSVQRQNTVLSNLTVLVQELHLKIKTQEYMFDKLSDIVSSQRSMIHNLETKMTSQNGRMDGIQEGVESHFQRKSDLETSITEFLGEHELRLEVLDNVTEGLGEKMKMFDIHEKRLAALNNVTEVLEDKLTRFEVHELRLTNVNTSMENLDKRVKRLEVHGLGDSRMNSSNTAENVDSRMKRIEDYERAVVSLNKITAGLDDRVKRLEDRGLGLFGPKNATAGDLGHRVEKLEGAVSSLGILHIDLDKTKAGVLRRDRDFRKKRVSLRDATSSPTHTNCSVFGETKTPGSISNIFHPLNLKVDGRRLYSSVSVMASFLDAQNLCASVGGRLLRTRTLSLRVIWKAFERASLTNKWHWVEPIIWGRSKTGQRVQIHNWWRSSRHGNTRTCAVVKHGCSFRLNSCTSPEAFPALCLI